MAPTRRTVCTVGALLLADLYDIVSGTSLARNDNGWMVVTSIIAVLAILPLVSAMAMRKRGLLR